MTATAMCRAWLPARWATRAVGVARGQVLLLPRQHQRGLLAQAACAAMRKGGLQQLAQHQNYSTSPVYEHASFMGDVTPLPPPTTCPGCGAKLQTADPSSSGFLPQSRLDAHMLALHNYQQQPLTRGTSEHGAALSVAALDDGSFAAEHDDASIGTQQVQRHKPDPPVCLRCHKLRHHNTVGSGVVLPEPSTQVLDVLPRHISANSLLVCVTDVLDFPGDLLHRLASMPVKSDALTVVINKIDLIPISEKVLKAE